MSEKPVRLGVLGYGHFVRRVFLPKLRQCEAIEIVGVYNRGEARRAEAAEDGYPVTGDLDELLGRDDVEAIFVGAHNTVHREHAVAAARAGKHIFCEKPMALTLEDIDAMVAEAQQAGVVTHVNYGGPYDPAFETLQQLAEAHCGKLLQVWVRHSRQFGTWKAGARHYAVEHPEVSGGWTVHHYCHYLNLACVLMGSENNPAVKVYHVNQASCPETPSEELCSSLITFKDGATAQICDGTTIGGFDDLGAIGTDGDVRRLGGQIVLATHGENDPAGRPGNLRPVLETFDVPTAGKNIPRVGELFARAVRTGQTSRLMTFPRVAHEHRILAACQQSAATGQTAPVPQ